MPQVPTVRQASGRALILQLSLLALILFASIQLLGRLGVYVGTGIYLLYGAVSRLILLREHRAGIAHVHNEEFANAIPRFEASFNFFERRPWIDNYRSLTFLSPSKYSYREMALANIGFCYTQLGDGEKAIRAYEKCLAQFPDSVLAKTVLQTFAVVRQTNTQP